jgi:hypothetical protein
METYAVRPYNGRYGDFDISTLFWGALVFLALFVFCLFAWRAIDWLRNRRKSDGVTVDAGEPGDRWDQAISRPPGDQYYGDEYGGMGGLGGMNQREQEELFSTYAPRKVRKAMKQRRKAREQAQKQSKGPN